MRTGIVSLILFAASWSSAHPIAAQGASREDRAAMQDIGIYSAGTSPDGLPASVDLRPWLPEVGEQTMNDCAAWAFGYAGRSYLEAIDQGWKPDAPERIFSPTFIYNQVNQGIDEGSRIDRVLDLLQQTGAATLATAPYLPKDYLTQPPWEANREAKTFRIAEYGVLPDGPWIRQALSEGFIVMCCVRTNPVFSSGRYEVYSRELHTKGQAARRPDQPHGFHAMAIVGYSDERQAFLFMNSWGKSWGDGGYVWVAYDVLDRFNQDGVESELMDFAVVMFDRREPIVEVNGRYQALALDELQATGFGTYAGYDEQAEQGDYRYWVSLRGSAETLDRVAQAKWVVPGPNGSREVSASTAENGFRLSGRSALAQFEVKCLITMESGHQQEVVGTIEIPEARKRQLNLERVDAFHESSESGDLWRWTLLPRLSDADWRDLREIRYEFPETNRLIPPAAYQHDGGLPPRWSRDSLAMPSFLSSQPYATRAVLRFVDGTEHELSLPASAFSDPVRTELSREVVWRPVGNDGDRHWSFYELQIRYPEAWADNILGIRIGTGNRVDWESHEAQAVSGPGARMHVFHGYAHRPFASSALAWFREPHPNLGRTTPVTDYEIHAFDPDSAWVIPEFEDQTLLIAGRGFGIETEDRYLGLIDGEPTWETTVYVNGTANITAINEVVWTTPEGEQAFHRDDEATPGPFEGYAFTMRTQTPFSVQAKCTVWNGESFTLQREIQLYAPRNDALTIDLVDITPHELSTEAPGRILAQAQLAGTQESMNGLSEVVAYPRRAWGGVLPTQLATIPYNTSAEDGMELGRLEAPRGEPINFLLHFHDGSSTWLRSMPHALAPAPALPILQLIARERFDSWKEGAPQWTAELRLRGSHSLLQAVESVDWELLNLQPGTSGTVTADPDALLQAQVTTSGPGEMRATLNFSTESGIAPQTVTTQLTTMSKRGAGPARVVVDRGWVADPFQELGPSVDPWAVEVPPTPYLFRIDGAPEVLRAIDQVEWLVRDPWIEKMAKEDGEEPPSPERHLRGSETRASGFAWQTSLHPDSGQLFVEVRLTAIDGTVTKLEAIPFDDGMEARELRRKTPAIETRAWGMVDGQPATLVIAGLPHQSNSHRLLRTRFEFDAPLRILEGSALSAFERPTTRRAFLATASGALEGYALHLREEDDMGFEEDWVELQSDGSFTVDGAAETEPLQWEQADEGPGSFWYLSLALPESLLAQADTAAWTVWQNGKSTLYRVTDRVGERSDRFELRVHGAQPARLEVHLERDGQPLPDSTFARELP